MAVGLASLLYLVTASSSISALKQEYTDLPINPAGNIAAELPHKEARLTRIWRRQSESWISSN